MDTLFEVITMTPSSTTTDLEIENNSNSGKLKIVRDAY